MPYNFLADVMVAIHFVYIAFVILGQLAIVLAAPFRRSWARNPWFRWLHLTTIGIVVVEVIMGWRCPLSIWEQQLREAAGKTFDSSETFLGKLIHDLLFIDNMPPQFFAAIYIGVLLLVLEALVMYPPRGFRIRSRERPLQNP